MPRPGRFFIQFLVMSKDPAFLFYPGDYLRDTQILSEAAQVAYDRIMCEHMRNICITQAQLNFITKRLDDDARAEIMHILTRVSGGYEISWVAESIRKRKAYSESRRKNRAKKEVKKRDKISKTYVQHMENEIVIENEIENEGENEENARVEIWPTFDDFWEAYDKKVDREKSEKKWGKLRQYEKEEIMRYLPAYVRANPDKQFRRNPTTFLNNRTWENEITAKPNGSTSKDRARAAAEYALRQRGLIE